jgi:hypothetical protein
MAEGLHGGTILAAEQGLRHVVLGGSRIYKLQWLYCSKCSCVESASIKMAIGACKPEVACWHQRMTYNIVPQACHIAAV